MKLRYSFLLLLFFTLLCPASAQNSKEETTPTQQTEKKKSFGQKLLTPFKWIGQNWSAYDPRYSTPSFYNWAVQLQNTSTMEWLRIENTGINADMRSRMSNKFGPYFGYQWFFYGFTIDLNTIGKPKSKNKNEFTLSINSNLVNLDIIRRRTGGDFIFRKLTFNDGTDQVEDFTDFTDIYDVGDLVKNKITGFNLNIFTNHKKYSNPAAFSNGAIQLRSAGTPIVGLGYTRQRTESDITSVISSYALSNGLVNAFLEGDVTQEQTERIENIINEEDIPEDMQHQAIADLLDITWPYMQGESQEARTMRSLLTTRFPSLTTIDDWHLQLGYAYNLVFSRRLLLGLSAVASPGLKRVRMNNDNSVANYFAEDLSRIIQKHEGTTVSPDQFRYQYDGTSFNLNIFARASLTFNYNRWRAGLLATYNRFFYNNNGTKINNSYGSLCVYAGYCFGRKKAYRYSGEKRQDYIRAALTKKQIEEMKDTMPQSNISQGASYLATTGKTRHYHSDRFNIDIFGCDLVAGPDGRYGWYEIQDGYVSPGQDTEGRIAPGKVLEIDHNGIFYCEAGHNGNFRTGNWWKSQLRIDQTPNHWYPEMLHYALRGKLTLYLRGRIFGTNQPVKLELEDFCINHGKETQNYFQMGIKSFKSNSAYSIEGNALIGGKPCRIYIEQKKRGKLTNMYISRIYQANSNWMARIPDDRPISTISIPGTHDAGAAAISEQPIAVFRASHTQNFSIPTQTADGIRAFDIRLKRNLHFGHHLTSRDTFDSTLVAWDQFLTEHPSECIIALIGSDESGKKWDEELIRNYQKLIDRYPHRFVQDFEPSTPLGDVRGKILVIRRQEACPYGKLLKFTDNAIFRYEGFHVEDLYKEHKTYKKIKYVEQHLREAYENSDPNLWYITFNSIAWSPRRHNPYSYAWGGSAKNIRKPMNKNLREFIELKDYTNFGILFLDFYNDHGDNPHIVETIIDSNFRRYDEE
ncbi:MAG: DUF4421 family protein [Bacteroidaceae bacterium]|nr:DUF4421 family protein [Bacteroidaceae bacterium]